MRLFSVLLLVFGLVLVPSAFAAQKHAAKAPASVPDKPAEHIYMESEVAFDPIDKTAHDQDGLPISGTIQSFYPNGRLAWSTQWINGKLHGITRGYYENRKLREETTWIDGMLNGPARWYDEEGHLRRETRYENDKDLEAPDVAQEKAPAAASEQAETKDAPEDNAGTAPGAAPGTEDGNAKEAQEK